MKIQVPAGTTTAVPVMPSNTMEESEQASGQRAQVEVKWSNGSPRVDDEPERSWPELRVIAGESSSSIIALCRTCPRVS